MRDGDGDGVEDDADDDARRRGFNPSSGTVVAPSSSAPHSAGAGSPGGETVGDGEFPLDLSRQDRVFLLGENRFEDRKVDA